MPNRTEISRRLIEVSDEIGAISKRVLAGERIHDLDEQVKRCDAQLADLRSNLDKQNSTPESSKAARG